MSSIRLVLNKTNLREVSSDTSLSSLTNKLIGELAMTNYQTFKLKGKCITTDCYNSVVLGVWCRNHLPPKRKNGKNIRAKALRYLAEATANPLTEEQEKKIRLAYRDSRRESTKQKIALIGQNLNA